MKYFKVLLSIEDDEEHLNEADIEEAVEETLQYLPYDLEGHILQIEETFEDA